MMHPFDVDPALQIGIVFEVSGNSIKAALTPGIDELSRLHRGKIYSIGIIGSLLKIHVGRRLVVWNDKNAQVADRRGSRSYCFTSDGTESTRSRPCR